MVEVDEDGGGRALCLLVWPHGKSVAVALRWGRILDYLFIINDF